MGDEKIRIRFETTFQKYRVTDTPFAVPIKLGRHGLAEIINHLLENDEESHQAFDFLVNGVLLRTSLKKIIQLFRISLENVLTVEYLPAVSLADETQSFEVPAWVGSVGEYGSNLLAGCYDGQIQVLNKSDLSLLSSFQAHDDPIRDICSFSSSNGDSFLATASKDQSIKIFRDASTNNGEFTHTATLNGHISSVECLDFWESRSMILSGDWNGNLIGWSVSSLLSQNLSSDKTDESTEKKSKKKQKVSQTKSVEGLVKDISSVFTIRAHSQAISGVKFSGFNNDVMYSCSWDHSLKKWDMETQDTVATYTASKVMTSLDVSIQNQQQVLTSHPDGKVRLWDTRQHDDALCKTSFSTKDDFQWIAQVKWHPSSEFLFASADYAGRIKIWDTRSNLPLGTSECHTGKGLCVGWITSQDSDQTCSIISGGSDCTVRSTQLKI